jgi:hypothetical protein
VQLVIKLADSVRAQAAQIGTTPRWVDPRSTISPTLLGDITTGAPQTASIHKTRDPQANRYSIPATALATTPRPRHL